MKILSLSLALAFALPALAAAGAEGPKYEMGITGMT